MLVDLVETTAADGLRLDGALHAPQSPASDASSGAATPVVAPPNIDGVLVLHGTGSNFYGSRFLTAIAAHAVNDWRAAALVANTRA
ncbi:MAG: hypothetical protein QM775_23825 [Pirellulales bacterium]